jgi:hypothetical protein
VVEIPLGAEEGERINTGFWESLEWDFAEDLLEGFGFFVRESEVWDIALTSLGSEKASF